MRNSSLKKKVRRAPGELRIVQDFLNTEDRYHDVDAFEQPRALSEWMCRHGLLDDNVELGQTELEIVLDIRNGVRALVAAHAGAHNGATPDQDAIERLDRAARHAESSLRFEPDGSVHHRSECFEMALGHLLDVVVRTRHGGLWHRLKLCADPRCQTVFYGSPHGKWCTPRCGTRVRNRDYRRGATYRRSSHRGAPRLPRLFRSSEEFEH